jgi:hypothetical protein
MTPKERAEELVKKFIPHTRLFLDELGWTDCLDAAKCCALVTVDEILHSLEYNTWQNKEILKYYEEVKQEIEKL